MHGEVAHAFGDFGYLAIAKHSDTKASVTCHMAMRSCKRRPLIKENAVDAMIDKVE
jgi:hypothetical protein